MGANWKCNGTTAFVKEITTHLINELEFDPKKLDFLVLPSFLHLSLFQAIVDEKVKIGAQNCGANGEGAFTGEVAADHLKDYGVNWVLIGHSERRKLYGETQEVITKKLQEAEDCELGVLYCCGENAEQRENEQ